MGRWQVVQLVIKCFSPRILAFQSLAFFIILWLFCSSTLYVMLPTSIGLEVICITGQNFHYNLFPLHLFQLFKLFKIKEWTHSTRTYSTADPITTQVWTVWVHTYTQIFFNTIVLHNLQLVESLDVEPQIQRANIIIKLYVVFQLQKGLRTPKLHIVQGSTVVVTRVGSTLLFFFFFGLKTQAKILENQSTIMWEM